MNVHDIYNIMSYDTEYINNSNNSFTTKFDVASLHDMLSFGENSACAEITKKKCV